MYILDGEGDKPYYKANKLLLFNAREAASVQLVSSEIIIATLA